jgi:ribosomal protein S21
MSVIVHSNENIDSALKRLHREVLREKILETYRSKQYRVKEADLDIQKRREWAKMKRRRRTAARRVK